MKKINIVLLLICMLLIFLFSSETAVNSFYKSEKVVETGTKFANKITDSNIVKKVHNKIDINYIIRKLAHFTEFLVLGILSINVLKDYFKVNTKSILIILVLCILYACTDEFHQIFIPGRTARVFDVLIDTIGCMFGIIIYYIFYKKFKIRLKS